MVAIVIIAIEFSKLIVATHAEWYLKKKNNRKDEAIHNLTFFRCIYIIEKYLNLI